jgi:hypothetical protein
MYVIMRRYREYVARPGSLRSYTRSLEDARKFETREEAERNKCGDETVKNVSDILQR